MDIKQQRLLPEMSLQELETEAIEFLRLRCGQSSNIGLAFSGGKDSVVIMELMKRSGLDFTAFYHHTQIDPPEVVAFIRKNFPEVRFLNPDSLFFRKILSYAPPLWNARWCCGILKHNSKQTRQYNPLVLGIRREESARRKTYNRWESRPHQTAVYPIFNWNEADVWEYIEWRKLPYCSLYDEGWGRLGCVPCPFRSPGLHVIGKRQWPGIYRAFENTVTKWFWNRAWQGRTMNNDTPEAFLEEWYHHKALWYRVQDAFEWRDQQITFMRHFHDDPKAEWIARRIMEFEHGIQVRSQDNGRGESE